jgi:GNAT superfamily N-acetyltransferase
MTSEHHRPVSASPAELGPARVVELIEANDAAFLLGLGRAGGGEERHDRHLHWIIGGSPVDYHNCVLHADLAPEQVEGAIEEAIEAFRAHGVPGTWHVGPSSRPLDLGPRLLARGFGGGWADQGMAADLMALPEDVPVPAELRITRVRDRQGLRHWAAARALDPEGELESRWVAEMYARIGLGDEVPWRHYLGWLGEQPVATATLCLGAGVAGLYFVLTNPAARRLGIGAAITLAALRDARAIGYRVGVLGASPMGHPLYRRLGFADYCRIKVYEWHPDAGASARS